MAEKMLKKDKIHQRYYIDNPATGKKKRVPGVTTITGVLAKPALKFWANKIGLDGIDIRAYVDTRAEMGTCAHDMVEAFLLGKDPYIEEFSKVVIETAENSVLSFHKALEGHTYKVISVEQQLVSQAHAFGGTCDIYWEFDGKKRLTDLKTGKAIYPDMWTQVAAYAALLAENGHPVDEVSIMNIPRAEDEKFIHQDIAMDDLRLHWQKFLHCQEIYELNKQTRVNSWG